MKEKILEAIRRGRELVGKGRQILARIRKALIPAVAALALIIGTDAPLYQDVIAILVALGVYQVPNAE